MTLNVMEQLERSLAYWTLVGIQSSVDFDVVFQVVRFWEVPSANVAPEAMLNNWNVKIPGKANFRDLLQ